MKTYPKEWEPRPIDIKSDWKNNSKVLAEIVSLLNDETYIEDENEMMEKLDIIFEILKKKYKISTL